MRWTVHGERALYRSDWVNLHLADVELPDGRRFDHHLVRMPADAVGTVVTDPDRGVLLLWRHRFISDVWGWEVPAGRVEPGEDPADAARRECVEETGWEPDAVRLLTSYRWAGGLSDGQFHLYVASGARHIGEPTDAFESERIAWVPVDEVRAHVRNGEVPDGLSLTALLWALAFDEI
ncbi:MAG: NUDIX hydrolase [Actinomycetota bacterium]|nr:NUDIX hydrolase [Actinomycetota bacterium]